MHAEGSCDSRFERVLHAFEANFRDHDEVGAAVAVAVDGELVVDLWAGFQDADKTVPWARDTMVNVWSIGKAVTAICLLQLVERGRVELDAPVARYWPEFAQAGKGEITVRTLMAHKAGLQAVAKPLPPGYNLTNWDGMCAELAAQEPWWEPGTNFGYHTNTYGFLLGEIVRRVDGRTIDRYLQEEIAKPLGVDFHFGFGPELDHRVADWIPYVRPPGEATDRPWLEADPTTLSGVALGRLLAYRNPPANPAAGTNSRMWRASVYPSTSGHANARAVATIFGALSTDSGDWHGHHVLASSVRDEAIKIHADGEDAVLGRPNRFGLGFQLTNPGIRPLGEGPRAFGHYGNGAVLGFADPDGHIAFGYVCNRAGRSWRDPRNIALVDAVYASIK
ncbi:MAG: serine hydrolase domain-containing protein [Dehalococcoidia bacterium]